MTTKITTWRDVYVAMHDAGEQATEIADAAQVSKTVIHAVIKGNYRYAHEPTYSAGLALLAMLRKVPGVLSMIDRSRMINNAFIPLAYAPPPKE